MSTINQKIYNLRKSLKLSQEIFADKTGVSRGYIAQIEKGVKFPSDKYLNRICETFNIDKSVLFYTKNKEDSNDFGYKLLENRIIKEIDFENEKKTLTEELNVFYQRLVDVMLMALEQKEIEMYDAMQKQLAPLNEIANKYAKDRLGYFKKGKDDAFDIVNVFDSMNTLDKIQYLEKLKETRNMFENSFYFYFKELYNLSLKSKFDGIRNNE
jgi:transcriptional regulator with XRE-family HTH domain